MAKKEKTLTAEERFQAALVPEEEQPYEIPENWFWIRFSNLASRLKRGKAPKYVPHSDIPVFAQKCNQKDGTIAMSKAQFLDPALLSKIAKDDFLMDEDIVINSTGTRTLGRVGFYRHFYSAPFKQVLPDSHVTIVRTSEEICKPFVYLFLKGKQNYLELQGAGTTNQKELRPETIGSLSFPLPPLAEQHRIVDRIETLFSKLEEAKEKAQAVIDGYEDRKVTVLHDAFTGKLSANWRNTNGISIDSWQILTLDDVASYKKGPFGSSITKAMFVPKGSNTYKVYEQGNAIKKTTEYGHYYINEKKYYELQSFAIQPGDIIISCAGTIGEVYKLPDECEAGVINQALMRVRINLNIEERFFIYYFGEVIKDDVIDQANGTAIKNIPPFKVMKAMKIHLPSLPEQKYIVNKLDELLRKEMQARIIAEQTIVKIQSLKQSILARAFRGELGTNDPSDEPATELLKRILSE